MSRASRVGIAFSIYRIAESDVLRKRCTVALICVFLLSWMVIMVVKSITCSAKQVLHLDHVDPFCLNRRARFFYTGCMSFAILQYGAD